MRLFTDAKIGQRLGIAFGITLALAAGMVVIGMLCVSGINGDVRHSIRWETPASVTRRR